MSRAIRFEEDEPDKDPTKDGLYVPNYHRLLTRYMAHVMRIEGVSFIDRYSPVHLTEEETRILESIETKSHDIAWIK